MSTTRDVDTTTNRGLPAWSSVLAVVAHPDDESFGLGAVLDAFVRAGTAVSVLCLTQGEASTVHGVTGDLATLRASELREAARTLGIQTAILREHHDGDLAREHAVLVRDVVDVASGQHAQGLVVFDPSGVTGHPDHAAATAAALAAAESLDLPVLAWTLPDDVAGQLNDEFDASFSGHPRQAADVAIRVDRERQRLASLAHASQAVPTSVLWRRLELLGDVELLRWLRRPSPTMTVRVDHRAGDRFDISVRDHVVTVDQPEDIGGEDLGPTPTELFVAGLASCVAFYARRYLRRHELAEEGLAVEASYRMASKPARVGAIDIHVVAPEGLPEERRDGLLAVAGHCTVHNSITTPPDISIDLR
jgi:LmbE family N-acetylglucosaminyl deacetylase/uncharacterized OsmC-like protein